MKVFCYFVLVTNLIGLIGTLLNFFGNVSGRSFACVLSSFMCTVLMFFFIRNIK